MTTATGTGKRLSVILTASRGRHDLAAPLLADHLGIPRQDALMRLSRVPSLIASDLPVDQAERLVALLGVFGLSAEVGGQAARLVDLSLQLAVWADAAKVARHLSKVLTQPIEDLERDLARRGGLILGGLDRAAANALSLRLAPVSGLLTIQSDQATALYDIHLTRPLSAQEQARLDATRSLLGTGADPLTEAVASGLDRRNRDFIVSRLADLDLLTLDRAFQRFDLLLTGATGWTTTALADFLVARTQRPRAAFEQLSPDRPLSLDRGLKLAVARQFCADYASIGLLVRPVLSSRGRNP